ncbi:protein containing DUF198 [sediment metagenome]|uniref:Protein containing DUF198 n=1 Tax=sediment metagenome TaxID=749907 RepID=D9PLG6_9ZZZZ
MTERAYDNPRFVEDLVRGVAARLSADPRVEAFAVDAENFESIHNHSAWARISRRSLTGLPGSGGPSVRRNRSLPVAAPPAPGAGRA